jgi:hypothetical protein
MVAGWGTGKTMMGILKGYSLSTKYANNQGLIVRKSYTDLKDSTQKDFTLYTGLKVPTNKDVWLPNKSLIMFRHMDELAGIVQNVNLGWFYIEQAEEFDTDNEFQKLRGRLRRVLTPPKEDQDRLCATISDITGMPALDAYCSDWRELKEYAVDKKGNKIPSPDSDSKDFYTVRDIAELAMVDQLDIALRQGFPIANANGHNWLWRDWVTSTDTDFPCWEATTFDNASNLSNDFLRDLKKMEKQSPSNYRRYVLNSHEDIDTADRVISYDNARQAINRYVYHTDIKRVVSCDPAEFGDDYTIIYVLENGKVIDSRAFRKKELMSTAGECVLLRKQWNASIIAVDDIGLGAGIRSRLNELGENVMGVNVGTKSSDGDKWRNLKAEIWMHAKQEFEDGNICLTDDEELIEQLTSVRYLVNSRGQIQIEPKKETVKRLGHSPDKADAFILGLWALSKAEAMEDFDLEEHETDLANSYNTKSLI